MTVRERLITYLWVFFVVVLFCVDYISSKNEMLANDVYEVYLDGKVMGYLENDDDLYDIINKKQEQIKKKYHVDKVYPPENFEIVKTNSYNVRVSSAEDIYKKISKLGDFTIEGYIVSIKPKVEEKKKQNKEDNKDQESDTKKSSPKKTIHINVLDRKTFESSINSFIMAFIGQDEFDSYMENTQKPIETTGKIIELMYFDETITIKKGYMSIKDKIYTDENDLTQSLLFGENYKINRYKVKSGDTIESISEDNKLNPEEFLIANPKYTSEDSMLKLGDKVNITLINPILTFAYEVNEVADTKIPFEKKIEIDKSMAASDSIVVTEGIDGVSRITTKYVVKNGETQSGVVITKQEVITAKVDQITKKGPSISYSDVISGTYVDDGSTWGWPTNYPYVISSGFGYRWGSLHQGIDISGTGFGSPIYATMEGTVLYAGWDGAGGTGCGLGVTIGHPNGYYTINCHMLSVKVSAGQKVSRGQIVGGMGQTGWAYGTHLHFGVWYGVPYEQGSRLINPMTLW